MCTLQIARSALNSKSMSETSISLIAVAVFIKNVRKKIEQFVLLTFPHKYLISLLNILFYFTFLQAVTLKELGNQPYS